MFETLDDSNFMLFAAKYYDNPSCVDTNEFEDDLSRIKYIKRLFRKYKDTGELRERLIFNHLIVLYNVFPHQQCTRMLCYKLYDYLNYLKPFLIQLNYWPKIVDPIGINSTVIIDSDVNMDQYIVDKIRKI